EVNGGPRCDSVRPLNIERDLGCPTHLHRISRIKGSKAVRCEDMQRRITETKDAVKHSEIVSQCGALEGIDDHYAVSATSETSGVKGRDAIGTVYLLRCEAARRCGH